MHLKLSLNRSLRYASRRTGERAQMKVATMLTAAVVGAAFAVGSASTARAQGPQGWSRPGGLDAKYDGLKTTANSVEFVDGRWIWVAGKDGYLARSGDGVLWTPRKTPVTAELNDVYF